MTEYKPISESNIEQVWKLSNELLIYDQLDLDVFWHKTLGDPDFDAELTFVAYENGNICGYMMGVCRKSDEGVNGGIKMFAVSPSYQGNGIASEMLLQIEKAALKRGADSLNIGFTRPNYITPGIDPRYTPAVAFLLRRGFSRRGDAYNMDVDLSISNWDTELLEQKLSDKGIVCRRLRANEKERLKNWMIADGFSPGWQYQVMCAAEKTEPCVFIAEKEGEIIAFAAFDGVRPGWFGPMGTSEKHRGAGVGTLTYFSCLKAMKEMGYKICEICAVGPLYFYSKTSNAVVSRIWWQMIKPLDNAK